MELWGRRKDPLRTFSGGMKRRLALARALLHDPQVIFFDEPTLGVDVQGRHVLWEHIKAEQAAGKTFIISTNDMAEASALAERLVIIDHGKTIVEGSPEELISALGRDIISLQTEPAIQDPHRLFVDLGAQNITSTGTDELRFEIKNGDQHIAAVVERVSAAHSLQSIRVARPTLDDVFLHYTGRALRE
jgi:ABC-type multidrug transport system ATPase subunit